jgi:serine protease Do
MELQKFIERSPASKSRPRTPASSSLTVVFFGTPPESLRVRLKNLPENFSVMTLKHVLCLAVSLLLTGGLARAQQPSAPSPPQAWSDAEPFGSFSLLVDGGGFLGVYAEDINKDNFSQYGLRDARGVGITEVVKDSPAEKAGLRRGDVIVRFDNEAVTSVRKLNRLVSEVAPDHAVKLSISRGGAEQEVSVTIGKRNNYADTFQSFKFPQGEFPKGTFPQGGFRIEGPNDGFVYAIGNRRRLGISTTSLTKQLADYFGVADGKGVLVTSVEADGPAAKAGIKAGDVITAVDGEKIEGSGDLSREINKQKQGDVTLTIIRDKRQQTIRVAPKETSGTLIQPGTPQATRRIVIPRIELPAIPAVNVALPQINLPVIPEINVIIPKAPKVTVVKAPRVPI